MILIILQSIYFFLPGYFANMAPVMMKKVPILRYRLDFGITVGGKDLLGKNKTFRGLFFGSLFGIGIAFLQYLLFENDILRELALVNYSNWLLIGFLMGFGAIIGDAVESFVKRRLNMPPGKPFIPFDQTDFVIGGLLFVSLVVSLSFQLVAVLLLLSVVLHIAVNHFAFYTGIRKEKW